MKYSLKVEYACRVLTQLGQRYGSSQYARIEELAESEKVPANYLVQILNDLRNGGLIASRRGKQGGYALARSPEMITLRDVIAILDPGMLDAAVGSDGNSGPRVAKTLRALSSAFSSAAEKYSLRDLMTADENMYYI